MPEVVIKIPPAFKCIWDKHRCKVFKGGRGSAKSESVARYLLTRGMEKPLKIVCGREFQASIKESVYDMLVSFIDMYGLDSFYKVLKTEIIGANGTTFSFVGLRHNIASIKSMFDVNIFWGEEAQTFSANSLTVLLPTIRAEGSELIFTMNPDLEEDPAYQMLVVDPPPDTVVTTVNYTDNPYFPDNLRALMESQKAKDYEKYLNVWEGYCKAAIEGSIFAKEIQKITNDNRITIVPYEKTKPVDLYFDLGRSDLTGIWFHQLVGFENRLLRYYENGGEHFSHYIQYLKSLPYAYGTIYLPHDADNELLSSTKTIKQQTIDAFPGVRVVVVPRIPQKALAIDAARGMMDTCYFDKVNCADGLSHLRKYHYRTDPETGKISREPEHDVHSNACLVAGTKILLADCNGSRNIEDFKIGDMVWTPLGNAKVLNCGMTKISTKLIRIKTNTREIISTPEHKFFTSRGIVRADSLVYNDEVWDQSYHLKSSIKEPFTTYRDDIISLLPAKERNILLSIVQYGLMPMALSLKDITSTISMEIPLIMRLKTLDVFLQQNISHIMQKLVIGTFLGRMLRYFSPKLYRLQERGMEAQRALDGIVRMGKGRGKIEYGTRRNVKFVEGITQHRTKTNPCIVQIVVGIEDVTRAEPVYDLTVEKHHCYLANGLLVSNCDAFMAIGQSRLPNKKPKQEITKKSIYVSVQA